MRTATAIATTVVLVLLVSTSAGASSDHDLIMLELRWIEPAPLVKVYYNGSWYIERGADLSSYTVYVNGSIIQTGTSICIDTGTVNVTILCHGSEVTIRQLLIMNIRDYNITIVSSRNATGYQPIKIYPYWESNTTIYVIEYGFSSGFNSLDFNIRTTTDCKLAYIHPFCPCTGYNNYIEIENETLWIAFKPLYQLYPPETVTQTVYNTVTETVYSTTTATQYSTETVTQYATVYSNLTTTIHHNTTATKTIYNNITGVARPGFNTSWLWLIPLAIVVLVILAAVSSRNRRRF